MSDINKTKPDWEIPTMIGKNKERAHCTLIPYWSKRLSKNKLLAYQLSSRKGEIFCEYLGDRVTISGHSTLFARGEIYL